MPKRSIQRRHAALSNTYRFFVDASAIQGRDVTIEDAELSRQLGAVLRLSPGDQVLLLDNSGWQYVVALTAIGRDRVAGAVVRKELAGGEPHTKLTLYVALLRPDRFEWVLQKGTELGVSAFVPVICEHSTIADADELNERKIERWRRIVREAAEQSRRGKLPRLSSALLFPAACDQAARRGTALLLWEGAGVPSLRQTLRTLTPTEDGKSAISGQRHATPATGNDQHPSASPFSIALFSGPEGGLTADEFAAATRYGMIGVTLGPRILRAETAPLVAASAIFYELGDLE